MSPLSSRILHTLGQAQRRKAAREYDRTLTFPLVMILGPFMAAEEREEIRERARRLAGITVLDFESQIEAIMLRARAIVSMGGYNTFCEILSFDKRALLVPRSRPRREQHIRAARAAFERLRQAARDGASVLLYSSDLDELLAWSDRILVVAKGKVHSPAPGADRALLGRLLLAVE